MTVIEIKTQLKQLIEQEEDIEVLQAICTLLQRSVLHPELKAKLTVRAQQAEADIAAGRLLSKAEMIRRTSQLGSK